LQPVTAKLSHTDLPHPLLHAQGAAVAAAATAGQPVDNQIPPATKQQQQQYEQQQQQQQPCYVGYGRIRAVSTPVRLVNSSTVNPIKPMTPSGSNHSLAVPPTPIHGRTGARDAASAAARGKAAHVKKRGTSVRDMHAQRPVSPVVPRRSSDTTIEVRTTDLL
jgi:hypothetical protein